ncbi:MAG: hypothetical protein H7319_21020 [Spirosoma sp.]|nr:hypothetical protein [Spirosoma sp.]
MESYFDFYNHRRFHQSLQYRTPSEVLKGVKGNTLNQVKSQINRTGGPVTTSLSSKVVQFKGRSVIKPATG